MKPTIFLDIDGVLNSHQYDDHPQIQSSGLERGCVEAFNRLIVATDPEIVLSSAWRYMVHGGAMTLQGFEYMLRTHGVMANGRLIGLTPTDEEIPTRGLQIRDWLNTHGGRRYVVIDDGGSKPDGSFDDMGLNAHPIVWTRGNVGLTDFDASKAAGLLLARPALPP